MKRVMRLPLPPLATCQSCGQRTATPYRTGPTPRWRGVVICRECYEMASAREARSTREDTTALARACGR